MLVLHIGYPKTATTSIQKNILNSLPNAITQYSNNIHSDACINGLKHIVQKESPDMWDSQAGMKLLKIISKSWKIISRHNVTIHSDERLLRSYFYANDSKRGFKYIAPPDFPIVKHIEKIISLCPNIKPIKIIITLRNQSDWIASRYAQDSNRIPNPSQKDFENQTMKIIQDTSTRGIGFLDYHKLVNDFFYIVGRDNVHPLLLENIDTKEFWDELSYATKTHINYNTVKNLMSHKRHNALKSQKNVWKLRKHRNMQTERDEGYGNIILTEDLRRLIRNTCREYNYPLSKFLNMNISSLGY